MNPDFHYIGFHRLMYLNACLSYSDHRSQLYSSDRMATNSTPRNMYLPAVFLLQFENKQQKQLIRTRRHA